ncbi:MAG: ATP-dependent sacrificial sulfur transferase LarE [Aminipila sp.]
MNENLYNKYEELKSYLKSFDTLAIAFSGGVDSTFLLYAANEAMNGKVTAITAKSNLFPDREYRESVRFAKQYANKHIVYEVDELGVKGFEENPPNRCYLCKQHIFQEMIQLASKQNIKFLAEGSNMDDMGDYRPGLKAIEELNVLSPLRTAGLYKQEIRMLSKEFGLETWNKPSFACLASRFVYGEKITKEKLEMVGNAEQYLLDLGFNQVRVRIHDELARIEIEECEMEKIMIPQIIKSVNNKLKALGFKYVSLDLQGYRTGSMNELL